jgi:hypothetical protein
MLNDSWSRTAIVDDEARACLASHLTRRTAVPPRTQPDAAHYGATSSQGWARSSFGDEQGTQPVVGVLADGHEHVQDLMMMSALLRLRPSGLLDESPKLAAYVARGEARPAYKRAFAAQWAINAASPQAG